MNLPFESKVALTGVGSGMGLATSRAFAEAANNTICSHIQVIKAEQIKDTCAKVLTQKKLVTVMQLMLHTSNAQTNKNHVP